MRSRTRGRRQRAAGTGSIRRNAAPWSRAIAGSEQVYVHARALPVYGGSPLPQGGHADFCVTNESFTLAAAQTCNRTGYRMARFTAVKPSQNDKGVATAYLAEDAEYTDEQARDAAIQRLLVIAGYDANPIDGIRSSKTDTAIAQFVVDNRLENTAAARSDFFDLLMAAAQKPSNAGFSWCNETRNTVMAAVGFEDQGNVVTRGWYRVAPGKCLRPDLTGKPRRLYSFGEAVGPDNQPLRDGARPAGQGGASHRASHGVLGRLDHPVHAQLQVRVHRPQGLRRQRADRHRLRHRGNVRNRRNDGAIQVIASLQPARRRCIRLAMNTA